MSQIEATGRIEEEGVDGARAHVGDASETARVAFAGRCAALNERLHAAAQAGRAEVLRELLA